MPPSASRPGTRADHRAPDRRRDDRARVLGDAREVVLAARVVAEERVEAAVLRQRRRRVVAEVPLADEVRRVAERAQPLGQRRDRAAAVAAAAAVASAAVVADVSWGARSQR